MEQGEKIIEVQFGLGDECEVAGEIVREEYAEDFLDAWMQDRTGVPAGLFYFVDKYGLYVAIDNKNGEGHMKAFTDRKDCRNWLEVNEFRYRRVQKEKHGYKSAFGDRRPAFGSDPWNTKNTILANADDLRQICIKHGWLNASSIDDMTKIMCANNCGWPLDHLATMIWMGTDYRKDLDDPFDFKEAGEQRKEILAVLTQYRDRALYNSMVCDRIDELEEAGVDISKFAEEQTGDDSPDKETVAAPKPKHIPKR